MKLSNRVIHAERTNSPFNLSLLCTIICILFLTPISPARAEAQARNEDARSAGWVVIPVSEYRNLHSKAYPTEPEP